MYHIFGYLNYTTTNTVHQLIIKSVFNKGYFGVNLFFVLSGFLITYLLLIEKNNSGTINIKNFYIRRILRIWPLFYLALLLGFFLFPLITHNFNFNDIKDHFLSYFMFAGNFDRINTNFSGAGNDNLGVLWSIAVEEQFYLFWPILIKFINKKIIPYVFLAIVLFCLFFRSLNINNYNVLYFHTFSVMSDMAVGGLGAYLIIYNQWFIQKIYLLSKHQIITIYIVGTIVILTTNYWYNVNYITKISERLVLALFFVFVILEQCFSKKSIYKLSNFKFLSKAGLLTYGFYCLHMYSISIMQKINNIVGWQQLNSIKLYLEFFFILAISVALSYISYRFFEKKLLTFKNRFN